jgi:putative transcriptional regulator
MFTWNVKEVAIQRGITSAVQLAERANIAIGTATALWYGRQTRIDLPILSRVCKVLKCTPDQILIYTPDDRRATEAVAA